MSNQNKRKLLIWGAGEIAKVFQKRHNETISKYFEIIAYIDSDIKKQGTFFFNKFVYSPDQICELDWDMILLCTINEVYQEEMLNYLQKQGIERKRIVCYSNCNGIGLMRDVFMEKYQDSKDLEIKAILQYIEEHELTVFNIHLERSNERYKVYRDSRDDDPYILVNDKRLYYPKEFLDIERTPFLEGIFDEQSKNSPHLYVPDGIEIMNDAVVVDVGAQVGDISLEYIDKSKELHIIESEQVWCRVLQKTFAPYRNKVKIYNVFLDWKTNQTIDSLISGSVDFVKMDVEGAEICALEGAQRILRDSQAFCAICAYHNGADEKNIKAILNKYGYQTSVSKGYMLFGWDDNCYNALDLRRGIVYGKKGKFESI